MELDTISIELPDYVDLDQTSSVLEMNKTNDIHYKIFVAATTLKKSTEEIKSLPISILPQLYNDCVDLYTKKSEPVQAIRKDGKTVVLSLAFKKTVGEFADLETKIQSGVPKEICTVLFQEFDGELEGDWVEIEGGIEVMYVNDDMNSLASTKLKKYDSNNNIGSDFYSSIPFSVYQSTINFIAGIGMSYSIISKNYSADPQLAVKLQKLTQEISDGLVTSVILERLTSFKSQKKAA